MSVREIEAAIARLPAEDLAELMARLREHAARVWDEQIDRDLQEGRLDVLLDEVDKDHATGLARPLEASCPAMIDPTRRTLLTLIEELSAACPEYRLGQMILNIAHLAHEDGDRRLWDVEDSELIEGVRKHLADWRGRHGDGDEVARPATAPASA